MVRELHFVDTNVVRTRGAHNYVGEARTRPGETDLTKTAFLIRFTPEGIPASKCERLTIGDRWMPSAELLASMPQPLIDKINEIVKRGG